MKEREALKLALDCKTCNASHKNTVERVIRCMGCKYRYDGKPPTNYQAKLKEKNT